MGPRFVVVSGLPASGKTQLGRELAATLRLPLIDKDDLLESLFERERGDVDPDRRRELSRLADTELERRVRASDGAVVVSFWRRPELSSTSGTPTAWLDTLADVVEVHCRCDPRVAADRFIARRRHPAHGDARVSREQLIESFECQAALGPLGRAQTVLVDTERPVDVEGVVDRLRRLDELSSWPA